MHTWFNSMKIFSLIYILSRLIIGFIFIFAGVSKLMEPFVFATLIDAYGLLPAFIILPVAILLPALEILSGAALVFDIRGSLTVTTALLLFFIAVLSYGISMGLDIDCGCFGAGDPEAKAYHGLRLTLYRDILMIAMTIYLFLWRRIKGIKALSPGNYFMKQFKKENTGCDLNY